MKPARALVLPLAIALALGAVPASAGKPAPAPNGVRAASLTQDGQQLVWSVRLDAPFTGSSLAQAHRSLCLVLERAGDGSIAGVLCVQKGRTPSASMRLAYQPVTVKGRGPAQVIAATISRAGSSELTVRFLPSAVHVAYAPLRWQILTTLLTHTRYFPSKPMLTRLHTPRPVGCVPSGPSFVTNGSTSRRVIALTFDDGPWPDTPQFLNILEREHVPATFFQIGRQVATYGPAVDARMLADGDIIGDHTWNHADVAGAGPFAAGEISSTRAAIARLTGFTPCLFRAPGGAVSSALISEARTMGFLTIQWNVDSRDWSRPGTGAIYSNVVGNAHNGSIVIQHDGGGDRSETLAALPQEIATLRSRGYQFVTIPQLLGLRLIYK
jgi:peptidoglycan/xylan/chitin deacetylase (PgdA/CDA1 family)